MECSQIITSLAQGEKDVRPKMAGLAACFLLMEPMGSSQAVCQNPYTVAVAAGGLAFSPKCYLLPGVRMSCLLP